MFWRGIHFSQGIGHLSSIACEMAYVDKILRKGILGRSLLCAERKSWCDDYNGYSLRAVRATAGFMPVEMHHFYMNSAGGVSPEFLILNNTGKTIKYINIRTYFYNRVNDPVYYAYRNYLDCQIIGPLKPWYCDWIECDSYLFYNSNVHRMYIDHAEIIFMDGSRKTVSIKKSSYRYRD